MTFERINLLAPNRSSVACAALVMTLSACTALPRSAQQQTQAYEQTQVAVPSGWSMPASQADAAAGSAGAATDLALWWQRFNDVQLKSLVEQALQANTSIRSAQAALAQSRALRDVQSAGLLPGVSVSGSAQRSKPGDLDTRNTFSAGLNASFDPDVFGGNRSALDATQADSLAAQATLGDVQVSIAAEVALAYIQMRGLQNQLQIARGNLASQQETLQITDWRAQAGLITALEVEQARAAAEQTAAQVPLLEASIGKVQHSLSLLTGQAPAALRQSLSSVQPVPQPASDLALSIPAQALRQRADVRATEHRIAAALARVSAADAARYPSFSIGGSLGLSALTLGALTNGASLTTAVLASVSAPLFDGGAGKARVAAQTAALEQARATYQQSVLTALKDVEDALVALQGDRARLTRLQGAANAAENAALLAQSRYTSGLIDFQTVLQTQRTLLSAQDSVASAQTDISADHVRLYQALGGGWNPTATN